MFLEDTQGITEQLSLLYEGNIPEAFFQMIGSNYTTLERCHDGHLSDEALLLKASFNLIYLFTHKSK